MSTERAPRVEMSDGRSLTERAYLRREAGETSGAGTDVCIKCERAKEPRRLNSDLCAECTGSRAKKSSTPKPEVIPMTAVRTSVSPDVFAALESEADAAGLTLAAHVRAVLTRASASPVPTYQPTAAEWREATDWLRNNRRALEAYPGPRRSDDGSHRSAVYDWYLRHPDSPTG